LQDGIFNQRLPMTCVAIRPDDDSWPASPIAMAPWRSAITPLRIAMANRMLRKRPAAFSVLALTQSSQICALRSAPGLTKWSDRQLAALADGISQDVSSIVPVSILQAHTKQ
jgi:hypothetical protein